MDIDPSRFRAGEAPPRWNDVHQCRDDITLRLSSRAAFRAVSVGQQLVDPVKSCMRNPTPTCDPTCVPGGDEPGSLAFSPRLAEALNFVDGALASTFQPLDARGLSRPRTGEHTPETPYT